MAKSKVVKVVETKEQKRERELNSFIKDKLVLLPDPTYRFDVGDRVTIGNLQDVYVYNIIENGMAYEIDYSSTDNNYGNPIKNEHQKMFVKWLDIRPYHNNTTSLIKNDDVRISYSQRHLGSLFSNAYYFGTNFEPDYQRDYVWEAEDKVALIDSIFNNVDIGKFAFIHLDDYSAKFLYEVLDGKQRIKAILDFYENRFSYKGKFFNDLSKRDQNHFEDYPISMAEVRESSKEQILKYFVKLNKHGKIMDKSQIEKVERMIEELNSK